MFTLIMTHGKAASTNMNNENEINDHSMWFMLWRASSDEQFIQEAPNRWEERIEMWRGGLGEGGASSLGTGQLPASWVMAAPSQGLG
jgi:hypothetical protein